MFLLVLVALHPLHAVHADGAGDCVKNTGASTGAMLLQRHSDVSKASSEASAVEALAEAERKYKRLVENMENMMAEVWKPVPRRSMLQVDDSEEGEEVLERPLAMFCTFLSVPLFRRMCHQESLREKWMWKPWKLWWSSPVRDDSC